MLSELSTDNEGRYSAYLGISIPQCLIQIIRHTQAQFSASNRSMLTMSEMNELCPRELEIIQKYDLSMEGSEDWDENRWDEYEIDHWDLEEELRERYYEIFPAKEMEESEEDKEEARKLSEEEEAA